jgi:ATP-dependent DNA ligase
MVVIGDCDRVRLICRGGIDRARRFPWIGEAARGRHKQLIIDGEPLLLVFHGTSDFNDLHSGKNVQQSCAPRSSARRSNS